MKLNLLFVVMYLLTLLAYPIVYAYGKLQAFARSKERVPLATILRIRPATPDRHPLGES